MVLLLVGGKFLRKVKIAQDLVVFMFHKESYLNFISGSSAKGGGQFLSHTLRITVFRK